jgi:hypothetical protein
MEQMGKSAIGDMWRGVGVRLLGLAAVVLAGSGCAHRADAPFHADARFTAAERVEIERGAAFLAEHTGRAIRVVFDGHGECRDGQIVRSADGSGGRMSGREESETACMYLGVAQGVPGVPLPQLAAHEIGHWIGLGHISQNGVGLMSPLDPLLVWTAEDEAECWRSGVCER